MRDNKRLGGVPPKERLSSSGLTHGSTVVDYGCGPGYFTWPAARLVGPLGKVYAVDIAPLMVDLVSQQAARDGLTNVTAVPSDGSSATLPDSLADFIICSQVIHNQPTREDRVSVARDLKRLLKDDGRILIVEWSEKRPTGISYRTMAADMAAAGLVTDGAHPISDVEYWTLARKRHPDSVPKVPRVE